MKSVLFAIGILAASSAVAGGSWLQTPRPVVPGAGRTASLGVPTGGLQSFGDPASFDAAVGDPGALVSENFDGGATAPGGINGCNEPLGSGSNDACFAPGDLVGGFSITSSSGGGLVALGTGLLGPGQSSVAVGANNFADTTSVRFDTPVTAISTDYYGGPNADEVTIEAFDASDNSLGTASGTPAATDSPVFIGIISATPIAGITITAANDDGELIDDLRFGDVQTGPGDRIFSDGFDAPPPPPPTPPTVAKAFDPVTINTITNSVLTITLTNSNATAATLTSDFTDTFPAGLVVATPSDATSTCASGTVTTIDGGDSVTLFSGAQIPAASSCTIAVSVTSAAAGSYTNTIAAGALNTDLGSSEADATADLSVLDATTCNPVQLLQDPGFELTDNSAFPYTNPFWSSTSSNFGSAFCDSGCGDGGGTVAPRDGTFWTWLGGAGGLSPETATVSQDVVITAGQLRALNFWLWVGAVGDGAANMDVSIDGTVLTSFPEPGAAEAGYTQRSVDVSAFADGGTHTATFTFTDPNAGGANYSLDDVTLDCVILPPTRPLPTLHAATGSTARIH